MLVAAGKRASTQAREDSQKQLQPQDTDPILVRMANPTSTFMRALACFQHRTLVAMAQHDLAVPFASAGLCAHAQYHHPAVAKRLQWSATHVTRGSDEGGVECKGEDVDVHTDKDKDNDNDSMRRLRSMRVTDARCEVRYDARMLEGLLSLPWRCMDVHLELPTPLLKVVGHVFPIAFAVPPPVHALARQCVDAQCDVLARDHDT